MTSPSNNPQAERDIAVIGMACRFPGARDYNAFWQNLRDQRFSVSEIPPDRWVWRALFGAAGDNTTDIKWGGFIKDVDKFDPLFFNISPKEADYIDPQHRLFLQAAWHAIEDAGYAPHSLAGRKIGVYAGVSKNDYAELMREQRETIISFLSTGTVHSILANRVSYLLDLRGKSEVVDTACSSFMVALNNAVRDIRAGTCEAALVGGVNAILTPTMYISHGKSGMLSKSGKCRTFDAAADGYVRAEGVGMVFVKPLAQAIEDQDQILGVIKGCAVQHGGRANTLTSPNVAAQASVIQEALADAAVEPSSISLIEAHGTGTPLGDPIEINALKVAFGAAEAGAAPHCALGTVKTNVGHLESAAGVAGLIKLLLCFKHRTIPALLHYQQMNPYIELENSPFYIANEMHPWRPPAGQPLRAGLSSFGMGGVNAHMIVEEPPERAAAPMVEGQQLLLVSAKKGRLKAQVEQLVAFLQDHPDLALADVSHTLIYGRDHFDERLAFSAATIEEATATLQTFLAGSGAYHHGIVRKGRQQAALTATPDGDLESLAQQWVQGQPINWQGFPGRKIALPTYPFRKRRCWFKQSSATEQAQAASEPKAALAGPMRETIAADAEIVRGHRVDGNKMLPAAGYLLWLWSQVKEKIQPQDGVCHLRDVYFQAALVFDTKPQSLTAELEQQADGHAFQIRSHSAVNCRGSLVTKQATKLGETLDLASLMNRCDQIIAQRDLYPLFQDHGLNYGPGFQVLERMYWRDQEALAVVDAAAHLDVGILDGVFQTAAALSIQNGSAASQQQVPYFLEALSSAFDLTALRYVYVKQVSPANARVACRFNMLACNAEGRILASFENFTKRTLKSKPANEPKSLLYYGSEWQAQAPESSAQAIDGLLVVGDAPALPFATQGPLLHLQFGESYQVASEDRIFIKKRNADDYFAALSSLKQQQQSFSHILVMADEPGQQDLSMLLLLAQALIKAKFRKALKILYFAPALSDTLRPQVFAVAGLARTLKFENAKLHLEVVGHDRPLKVALDCLQAELQAAPAPLHEVAYQKGQRHIRAMSKLAINPAAQAIPFKQGGVYLVTGGAGGLGRIFCKHLAQRFQARLVLLGRRQADTAIDALLQELRDLGGQALYVSADVGQADQVEAALEQARRQFGALQGVIHGSGVIDDSFILKSTLPSFHKILAPKIQGTHNLDTATAQDQLDFFVMFSSVAALMPNQGQSGYAAGNAFMDAFADYRDQLVVQGERTGLSLAINWPLWADGGMQVTKEEQAHLLEEFGMQPLATEQGIQMLYTALAMAADRGVHHLAGLVGDATKVDKSFKIKPQVVWQQADIAAFLRRDLTHMVAQIVQQDEIEPDDTFDELGLDSLGCVKVTQAINQTFATSVKPTLFYECDSLALVAKQLLAAQADAIETYYTKLGGMASHYGSMGLLDIGQTDREQGVYRRTYTNREFYMVDHVVEGKYNVPGACYIEMARQAAVLHQPDRKVTSLTKNYWAKQLSSDGPAFTAHIQLQQRAASTTYEIYSLDGAQKTVHATGEIGYETHAQAQFDLDAIRQRCGETRDRQQIYAQIHAEGLHVGPSFMPLETLALNADEALAEMVLPQAVEDTWQDYLLHPSLLTGVFQVALINNRIQGDDEREFIPIAIEAVSIQAAIPKRCFVYSQVLAQTKTNPHLKKFNVAVCDAQGRVLVQLQDFAIKAKNAPTQERIAKPKAQQDASGLQGRVEAFLMQMMAPVIGIEPHEIDAEDAFEVYGINSIMITDLNSAVEEVFGSGHSKTLFFENVNVRELAEYFIEEHRETVLSLLPVQSAPQQAELPVPLTLEPKPVATAPPVVRQPASQEIAIIGLAGRYPDAENMDQLWQNLKLGRDSVREIPRSRFDYMPFYDPERNQGGLYAKWGSFIDDVDKFDPLFFNISPREAELIDPQERLLLQTAWETLEDAGYSRQELARTSAKTGVFIGALWQPYTALGVAATLQGNRMGPSGLLYSTANRISYFFDFQGPSMAVDTACSASLTALHLACHSIRRNECQTALAGGVNLSLDVSKYLFLSDNSFLSSEGKCRSFGAGGDGYVPGEGVGLVLLKRLDQAVADGDHIYGVIKGTAINHGGKTNGYTVPKPQAQAEVITEALREAQVDPRSISYVEAHGTGTALGDPIEITGLTKAFGAHTKDKQFCAIGSIKSNIGHLEANAAMAGLSKILLQFKHRELAPSLHSASTNPNIDFTRTPFYVQHQATAWHSEGKRRSALSSFGAGGSNAHMIVEEYVAEEEASIVDEPVLVPLSAKTDERLALVAQNLLTHLLKTDAPAGYLRNLAYTLQVGREAMRARVAFVVADLAQLADKLQAFIKGEPQAETYVSQGDGTPTKKSALLQDRDFQATVITWLQKRKYALLAELWAQGAELDWHQCYAVARPKRVPLPVYPFLKESYWLPVAQTKAQVQAQPVLPVPPTPVTEQPQLEYQHPSWYGQGLRPISERRELGPMLFINTLTRAGVVEQLKQRFDNAKVLNVKKQPSYAQACGVYVQLYQALKQHLGETKTLVLLTHDPLFYAGFSGLFKTLMEEQLIERARLIIVPEQHDALLDWIEQELHVNDNAFAEVRYIAVGQQALPLRAVKSSATQAPKPMPDEPPYRDGGVYWITGGMGALGQHFAAHLATRVEQASIVLSGRRAANDPSILQAMKQFSDSTAQVTYLQCDLTDRASVAACLDQIVKRHGSLNGVIHAAGVVRDAAFLDKKTQDLRAVLAPKISGTVHLDQVTQDMPLDFFVCCSSISAVRGNRGQSDYAMANAFMDAFVVQRQILDRPGKNLSINWPLWRDGGMQVTPGVEAYLKRKWELDPLPTDVALECFDYLLASSWNQAMPLYRDAPQDDIKGNDKANKQPVSETPGQSSSVTDHLKAVIGRLLKLDLSLLDEQTELTAYGFDSISLNALAQELSESYQREITSALFFEYDTIGRIAAFLGPQAIAASVATPAPKQPSPSAAKVPIAALPNQATHGVDEPIAIIGLDGRFPGAADLTAFWDKVINQEMAVSDLPKDGLRFNDASVKDIAHFGGGFIKDVDHFDAAFFGIDDEEARLMDPQQRLLLQSVWKTVEYAGYNMAQLAKQQTGLFIGVGSSDYLQLLCAADSAFNGHAQVGISPSMLANRISYLLNLQGPSEISDTACSSSIVAIHRAIRSLREGECDMAIAGGVSLLLSTRGYQGLKHLGFLSPTRASRSFDAAADGYVRGEGVGSVLLKPLSQAERDRDQIHAVIKGSAVFHGGKSTLSLIAPSKNGQIGAMLRAYRSADIHPETVQYVEAHGTATSFGDPAEISALKQAFTKLNGKPYNGAACGIGALKPNIGHLEAASGIAALIKLTMALKMKKKPPLSGFQNLHPGIVLDQSPFYIVREAEDWAEGSTPRRAGLNSYGFGGVNSHLVLEEYKPQQRSIHGRYEVVTLSAHDPTGLEQSASELLAFLQNVPERPALQDISFTLSTGRTPRPMRLAIVAQDLDGLIERLQHFREHPSCLHKERNPALGPPCAATGSGSSFEQAAQLARRWMNGETVDWQAWFAHETPHRVALPTQQFNGKSYWYDR